MGRIGGASPYKQLPPRVTYSRGKGSFTPKGTAPRSGPVSAKPHVITTIKPNHPSLLVRKQNWSSVKTPGTGKANASVKGAGKKPKKPPTLQKKIGNAAESQAKADLKRQGYTDQVVIENRSGQGTDLIGRNPKTGDVKVVEVKANTAGLGKRQQEGGRENTKRVIDNADRGSEDGTWRDAKADAEKAKEWIKDSPDTKYEIWKYKVDPETGAVTNPRKTDWDWEPGEKPGRLKYDDLDTGSKAGGQPDIDGNPPTGPPSDGGP